MVAGASGVHTLLQGSAADAYVVSGASRRHTASGGCQGRQQGPGPTVGTLPAARVPGCLHVLLWLHSLPLGVHTTVEAGVRWVSGWRCVSAQLEGLAPSAHMAMGHVGWCLVLTQRPGLAARVVPGL